MDTDPSFSERTVTRKKANFRRIKYPQCCYNVATVFYSDKSSPARLVVLNKLNFRKVSKVFMISNS
jgi:hypothetical protein